MGKESSDRRRHRRRRRRIAGGVDAEAPASIHIVASDLLERILLRVGTAVSLIRAAATCKPWRRVIADDGFLRRFRRINGPHMLGHYYQYRPGFMPDFFPLAEPEGRPANAIDRARVTANVLPASYFGPLRPVLQDTRGGLLAFVRDFGGIIVCSPWTRQHVEIRPPCPSPPCMPEVGKGDTMDQCLGVFLLDAGPGEERGTGLNMSNFRLLCVRLVRHCYHGRKTVHDDRKTVQACVFSAGDGRWLSLSTRMVHDMIPRPYISRVPLVLVGRVGGSICWSIELHQPSNLVLHLNESTGEFSYLRLPDTSRKRLYHYRNLRVIGAVHLARIVGNNLEVLRFAHGGGACVVERRICLSCHVASSDPTADVTEDRRWYFSDTAPEAAAPGCVLLCDDEGDLEYIWTFSADTQNMQQERVQKLKRGNFRAFPCELPWPPSFSACWCDE